MFIFSFFKRFKIVFILPGCPGSSLLCAGFLQLWWGDSLVVCGLGTAVPSLVAACRLWGVQPSVVRAHGLSGVWNLPLAGTESVSSALARGFLTTGPPEKSTLIHF